MRKQSSRWDMIFQLCQITAMNCFNKELMSVTMIVFPTKLLFGRVIYYFYIWSDRVIDTIRDWQFFPCIFIFSWGKIVFHCTVDRNTLIHSLSLSLSRSPTYWQWTVCEQPLLSEDQAKHAHDEGLLLAFPRREDGWLKSLIESIWSLQITIRDARDPNKLQSNTQT